MYGLLLRTLQDYVLANFDPASWERIRVAGGFLPSGFEPLLPYGHEVTRLALRLTSLELERPVPVILEDLGTWVIAAAYNGAARRLLRFCGADFTDFLLSLGELPDRARLALPDLALPDLDLEEAGPDLFRLTCRDGLPELSWILLGALRAMADDYGALVLIEAAAPETGRGAVLTIRQLESRFSEGRRFELARTPASRTPEPRIQVPGPAAAENASSPVASVPVTLSAPDLERLFPLCLMISGAGEIRAAGPLMRRIFPGQDLTGSPLLQHFHLRGVSRDGVPCLPFRAGQRIRLEPVGTGLRLRGSAIAPANGDGLLLVFSFGIDIISAVGLLNLSDADFAITDMAMELLCLAEANALAMAEMRALSRRLEGARAQAEDEARTDPLTGLRNRRACDSFLARLCRDGGGFTLLHLDLDYFKEVNDRHGHAAGDEVLISVAAILLRHTRSRDFIARVGGDEFVAILPGLVQSGRLEHLAGQVIAQITRPVAWKDVVCRVSASIGMVTVAKGGRPEPARVLDLADRMLYAAKAAGRGRVISTSFPGHGLAAPPGFAAPPTLAEPPA